MLILYFDCCFRFIVSIKNMPVQNKPRELNGAKVNCTIDFSHNFIHRIVMIHTCQCTTLTNNKIKLLTFNLNIPISGRKE